MREPHYLASEDSALLRKALGEHSGQACLEIGAGNGGNLVDLAGRFELVVGTDLVRPGMDDWRDGGNYVLADGASCLRGSAFDLVAFNPPYLPEEVEDRAVDGGRGLEVPKRMLREALGAVKRDGEVMFLLNDHANVQEFEEICAEEGFRMERVRAQRVFFEELAVYRASAKD